MNLARMKVTPICPRCGCEVAWARRPDFKNPDELVPVRCEPRCGWEGVTRVTVEQPKITIEVKLASLAILAILAVSCGGHSPVQPSPGTPLTPVPVTMTALAGTVTTTNGGQAVSGASVDALGAASVQTDPAGRFLVSVAPTLSVALSLHGPNIVSRVVYVNALTPHSVQLDAISLTGFDLSQYRALVRNGYEAPNKLEPLRRWTVTPNIYLKTVDEAGEAIHGPTLDLIEATIRTSIPQWTGGVLHTPTIERGTGSREGVSGWITVKFPATNTLTGTGVCGRSQTATNGGWIELGYHVPASSGLNCRVPGAVIAPRVVRHELGHALGFWHTANPSDLMHNGNWDLSQANMEPTASELALAWIAYHRPVGNVDPDSDAIGTIQ